MVKEGSQQSEEKPKDTSKDNNEKPKSIRRQVCCCLSIFGVLFLLAILSISQFVCSNHSSRVPVFNSNTSKPTPTTQTASYPTPGNCEPLNAPETIPLAISTDNPGVHEKSENHYYQIYGYTQNDIYNQINACGPKAEGKSFFGLTKSRINWTYSYTYVGDSCTIKDASVGVHVEIYYPKWDAPAGAASGLAQKWEDYMPKLELHENGHRENSINAANEIYSAIKGLGTLSCTTMHDQVNSVANNIIADLNAIDQNYDDSTNHGETQGADF